YSYAPLASVPTNSVDEFIYTITDADGDTSTAKLTIDFTADVNTPSLSSATATTSDAAGDDNTAGSNADAFAAQTSSGSLHFDFGADGAGGSPVQVSYDQGLGAATQSVSNGILTLTGTGWTLVLNESTGDYTFTQTAAFQHAPGSDSASGLVTVTLT